MYKKERAQISKIYEAIHRQQNMYMLEFLILIQNHGIGMMNYYRMQATSMQKLSTMLPKPRINKQLKLNERVESLGRKVAKLSHDLAIMELAVLTGGPLTAKESAKGDYQKYLNEAIESPFKRSPSAQIWVDMNSTKNQSKMKEVIERGIREGKPRLEVIASLETFLRVDRQYPRWLQTRLRDLSPPRSGNPKGLLSGYRKDKKTSGFSYIAHRLYNTQTAAFSADFSTRLATANPYYSYKNVVLSPYHPMCDKCDKAAKKRWKVSDNPLPIHPNCLCFYRNYVSDSQIKRLKKDYQDRLKPDKRNNDYNIVRRLFKGLDILATAGFLYGQYIDFLE